MARLLRVTCIIVLVMCAASFVSTNLLAQTDLGSVQGQVQDQQGRAISGASVNLKNPATSFNRTAQTDPSGFYSFLGVPLTGNYVLLVSAPQFSTAQQEDILLRAGGTAVFNF